MSTFSKIFRYSSLFTLALLSGIIINVQAINVGYKIEKETKAAKSLSDENNYMLKKINSCRSPKTVQNNAYAMGLKYPEPYTVVLLEDDGSAKASGRGGILARLFGITRSEKV